MSTKSDTAVNVFNSGLNCSQSVLSVFCEKYGMDKKTALKAAGGLGSGFRSGEVCGAASGAVIVIGLKYGQSEITDKESKAYCNAKTEEFIRAFKERNKTIICREILGVDLSTSAGKEQAENKNLYRTTCAEMVKSAVEILEGLGY